MIDNRQFWNISATTVFENQHVRIFFKKFDNRKMTSSEVVYNQMVTFTKASELMNNFLVFIHSFPFSTIFKHWSENSVNRGSCMATFIASYLLSALSMDSNNCLRCGLQSRSLSSFDWPVIKGKKTLSTFYWCSHSKRTEGKNKWLPRSCSLCRGTLSVTSSSSKRSSTVHGSAKTVVQMWV